MRTLAPFSKHGPCPKCTSTERKLSFESRCASFEKGLCRVAGDHLHVLCLGCAYRWPMACADAPDPAPPVCTP